MDPPATTNPPSATFLEPDLPSGPRMGSRSPASDLGGVRSSISPSTSPEPSKAPKKRGGRAVSSLNPIQLARKRANDREAQRVIRARTKELITTLEVECAGLRLRAQNHDGEIQQLRELVRSLVDELHQEQRITIALHEGLMKVARDIGAGTSALASWSSVFDEKGDLRIPPSMEGVVIPYAQVLSSNSSSNSMVASDATITLPKIKLNSCDAAGTTSDLVSISPMPCPGQLTPGGHGYNMSPAPSCPPSPFLNAQVQRSENHINSQPEGKQGQQQQHYRQEYQPQYQLPQYQLPQYQLPQEHYGQPRKEYDEQQQPQEHHYRASVNGEPRLQDDYAHSDYFRSSAPTLEPHAFSHDIPLGQYGYDGYDGYSSYINYGQDVAVYEPEHHVSESHQDHGEQQLLLQGQEQQQQMFYQSPYDPSLLPNY